MPQGVVKKGGGSGGNKPQSLGPKKGQGIVKPKKQKLLQHQKMMKKMTSGLVGKTERNLAEKAGHLEMLKGGKKDNPRAVGAVPGKKMQQGHGKGKKGA